MTSDGAHSKHGMQCIGQYAMPGCVICEDAHTTHGQCFVNAWVGMLASMQTGCKHMHVSMQNSQMSARSTAKSGMHVLAQVSQQEQEAAPHAVIETDTLHDYLQEHPYKVR